MSILSTLFAVIYRLSAAYGKHELLTTVPGIFGIAATQVLLVSPASAMIGVAVFNAIEHQGEMVQEALSAYPELVPIFEENRCGVSTTKNNPIMVAAIVLAIVGMMAHVATTRSYVIHMQLVVALAVQVSIPTLTMVVPFAAIDIVMLTKSPLPQGKIGSRGQ
ncbi:hypothetical protein AAVH_11367 [Aphelenchoides avenae]|nr:hypothetical protein AAVH_11367 [Aphelenchus avenae]